MPVEPDLSQARVKTVHELSVYAEVDLPTVWLEQIRGFLIMLPGAPNERPPA